MGDDMPLKNRLIGDVEFADGSCQWVQLLCIRLLKACEICSQMLEWSVRVVRQDLQDRAQKAQFIT